MLLGTFSFVGLKITRPDMRQTGLNYFNQTHLADMTVEVHEFVGGSVIGFNGVAEWALDSVALEETVWLPREDQLRAVLGHDFVGLGLTREGYAVVALVEGEPQTFVHEDAEEAYGLALLEVLAHR